jgi:hypothetical protein
MMNSFEVLDPKLFDQHTPATRDGHHGYTDAMKAMDTRDVLMEACGAASREFPKELWIEPREWPEFARENDEHHTWPLNFIGRFTNQNPSHECVYHSLTRGMECCRNRQRGIIFPEGPKKDFRYDLSALMGDVWLAPLSGYAEVQPRQWGGANVRDSLELACRRGLLPDKVQPRDYGFKHTLQGTSGQGNNNQSGGPWIPFSQFPENWQETAKHFKVLAAIFPTMWEQAVCLVLRKRMVHVGRSGHAVPWSFYNVTSGAMGYADSYDVVRWDSASTIRNAWQGSFAIDSMTVPDDWSKPGQ